MSYCMMEHPSESDHLEVHHCDDSVGGTTWFVVHSNTSRVEFAIPSVDWLRRNLRKVLAELEAISPEGPERPMLGDRDPDMVQVGDMAVVGDDPLLFAEVVDVAGNGGLLDDDTTWRITLRTGTVLTVDFQTKVRVASVPDAARLWMIEQSLVGAQ